MNRFQITATLSLTIFSAACASDPVDRTSTVKGALTSKVTLDNARAVAIGSDGRTFWAYLDRKGQFSLKIPVGQAYRLVFGNQLASGGQEKIAYFAQNTAGGGESEWLGVYDEQAIDLGRLTYDGAGSATTHAACAACSGGSYGDSYGDEDADDEDDEDIDESEHDDDPPCHASKGEADQADDDEADDDGGSKKGASSKCDVCSSHAPKKVKPKKDPGKDCEEKTEEEGERRKKSKPPTDSKACPYASSGSNESSPTPSAGGGSGGARGTTSGTTRPTAQPEGASCAVSSGCTTSCSCVASTCTSKY